MLMTMFLLLFGFVGGLTVGIMFYPFFERILSKLDLD